MIVQPLRMVAAKQQTDAPSIVAPKAYILQITVYTAFVVDVEYLLPYKEDG